MKKKRVLSTLLAAVILTAALSTGACAGKVIKKTARQQSVKVEEREDASSENYADEMVKQINKERKKAGQTELQHSEALDKAAEIRAQEMLKKYSHTRPDGTEWKTILDDQKISYVYWGENINEKQKSVSSTMKSWMNSEGHKENILRNTFDSVGIGRAKDKNGTYYWVQIFTGGSK